MYLNNLGNKKIVYFWIKFFIILKKAKIPATAPAAAISNM